MMNGYVENELEEEELDEDLGSEEEFGDEEEDDEADDSDRSWGEATQDNGIFYGDNVVIAMICQEKLCPHCREGKLIKPLKWKIAIREGRNWTVVEEHPFDCDVDAIFSEYGHPTEFTAFDGYYRDSDVIRPLERR